MSRGHCANAKLVYHNEQEAMYEYCCYNLNLDSWKESENSFDGYILVKKECLVKPVIRTKMKKIGKNKRAVIKKSTRTLIFQSSWKKRRLKL